MKNQPYVKNFDNKTGELLNPITKENPYLHQHQSRKTQERKFKYVTFVNPVSGAFYGQIKIGGNNRKPCASAKKRKDLTKRAFH